MDNDPPDGTTVKRLGENNSHLFIGGKGRLQKLPLVEMQLRIDGYLRGCFANGAPWIIWDNRRFRDCTRSAKPRKLSHVQQAMTQFRKSSTNWVFEDIWLSSLDRDEVRRRHRRIKVWRPSGRQAATQMETTLRLLAYVKNAVKMNGTAKIDRIFLAKFMETTGLPEEWIRIAWQRIKKIRGYRVKWKGVGAGRKAVISLPYFSTRSSLPSVRRFKTVGPAAPEFLPGRSTAAVAASVEKPPAAPDGMVGRPYLGASRPRPGSAAGKLPPPFFVAGRWVSSAALMPKACWIALNGMRTAHAGTRVRWRMAHARNLAFHAMRNGHTEKAIVAAWRSGIADSHEDACDQDLRQRPMPGEDHPLREPSSAVAYAWKILKADARTPEERWAAFFAEPRAPRAPSAKEASPKSGPGSAVGAGSIGRVGEGQKGAEQRTIEAALKSHGMNLQDLLKLNRADQAAFLKRIFEAQKSRIDKKNTRNI